MRVTQIHVRDAKSVREYAYREDRNISYRPEMEDSISFLTKITLWKIPSFIKIMDCMPFLTDMAAQMFQNFALKICHQYLSIQQDFQGGVRTRKFKHTASIH